MLGRGECVAVMLSGRLQAVANAVPQGTRVVDVGTDHALLPIYLIQTDRVVTAIATDIAQAPAQAATTNVLVQGLSDRIEVRVGPGLETVEPGEVDTVMVAGMGGATIRDILVASTEVLDQVQRVIVQPMNLGHHVRKFFFDYGWTLSTERVLRDQGHCYEVFAADRKTGTTAADDYREFLRDPVTLAVAMQFGPTLLRKPTQLLVEQVRSTHAHWCMQLRMMQQSTRPDVTQRVQGLQQKIQWVQSWLAHQLHEEGRLPSC